MEPTLLHTMSSPKNVEQWLTGIAYAMVILDRLTHVQFFAVDTNGYLIAANKAFCTRRNHSDSTALLGQSCADLTPALFGPGLHQLNLELLQAGESARDQLELHHTVDGSLAWCLAHRFAVLDHAGSVVGLMGMFIDLPSSSSNVPRRDRLMPVHRLVLKHPERMVSLQDMEAAANLSAKQLERECKRVFWLTPRQMLMQARVTAAVSLLMEGCAITEVAARSGYTNHSAFSRQFKALTGFTPVQFRQIARP
ncbi:AraC family transcriptional regulator [Pseudomonas putida]|uniref:helix-turn-helix domain-containing protein n=1 Tax=Pseudomonas putida TaxID=303 RepID=UPI00300EC0E4